MSVVGDFWSDLSGQKKIGLLLGFLMIVVMITLLSTWVFRTQFDILFSELSDNDAAAITAELESLKIPYQLSNNGKTISVEQGNVHETRLKLTSTGVLVKGGVGFELFDDAEYGMSDFAQKINYQRAIQGELSRTIMSLNEVKRARVHLVMPSTRLFQRSDKQASASISLVLERGAQLSKEQVIGIQRLISSAVKNLDVQNIVIVDQKGIVLTKNINDESEVLLAQLEKKNKIESYLSKKIHSIVTNVFGPDMAVVNVDATLNFDKVESQFEKVLPSLSSDSRGVVTRSVDTRAYKVGKANTQKTQKNGLINETSEVEYKLGKAVERVVHSTGNIVRLSISVMVPNTASVRDVATLKGLIGSAVGINVDRGDVIEVHPLAAVHAAGPVLDDKQPLLIQENNERESQHLLDEILETSIIAVDKNVSQRVIKSVEKISGASGNPVYWLLFVLIAVVVILMLVIVKGKNSQRDRLEKKERDVVLQELKAWLNEEGSEQGVIRR